ncbi:hypothetical protein [Pseudoalteromonas piscicida]|uniref:hypothetical protein n=1 Tax=Pseudoalteromonas piscicida TaxID=43662 RepID=UPI0030B59886
MNAIEQLRENVISELLDLNTMKKVWPQWSHEISKSILNYPPTNKELRDLGNNLYTIFKGTSSGTRSQDEVSGGGAAWEGLVCWYLNLCLIGSRTVIIKSKKAHIPEAIQSAISVNYGNFKSNTESDLLAITFPDSPEITGDYIGEPKNVLSLLSPVVESRFHETELVIIQCKTNWNDNAQIPMLWDLIYSSQGFKGETTVGSNGYSHKKLQKFSYAFVTVPTVNPDKIKTTSTCVKRVQNLSGGNFWGLPSKTGVAMNLAEILDKNFQTTLQSYKKGWNSEVSNEIREKNTNDYFKVQ